MQLARPIVRTRSLVSEIRDGQFTLFDYDYETGRSVWVAHDPMTGQGTFRIDYPVDATIRANVEAEKASHGKRFGDYAHIASIPMNLYHGSGLAEAQQQADHQWVSRWLNDSDNRAWRASRGNF